MTICKRQYLRQIYELVEQGSAGWIRPKLVTLWKISAVVVVNNNSTTESPHYSGEGIVIEEWLKENAVPGIQTQAG